MEGTPGENLSSFLLSVALHTTVALWPKSATSATPFTSPVKDIPKHYVFSKTDRQWLPCKCAGESGIRRMYSANFASDPERYCLQLLLILVAVATSYEELRTVNGVHFQTFREAGCLRA